MWRVVLTILVLPCLHAEPAVNGSCSNSDGSCSSEQASEQQAFIQTKQIRLQKGSDIAAAARDELHHLSDPESSYLPEDLAALQTASLIQPLKVNNLSLLQPSKNDARHMDYGITISSLDGCLLKLDKSKYSTKLQSMSGNDKRNTAIVLLNRKGKASISDLQKKNDEQLFSLCWETVEPGKSSADECLLKTGERNRTDLNDMSGEDKRNTEVVMFHRKGMGSLSDLQAAGNGQLYSMCYQEILKSMQCYLDRYPVVGEIYGKHNLTAAEEHYETEGEPRGLDPQCRDISKFDDSCNWQCYLDNTPRLAKAFGKTNTSAARLHYDAFGLHEGNNCRCTTTTTTMTYGNYIELTDCGLCGVKPSRIIGVAQSCICDVGEAHCKAWCNDDPTCRGISSSLDDTQCQFLSNKQPRECPKLNGKEVCDRWGWFQTGPLMKDIDRDACDTTAQSLGKKQLEWKGWKGCQVKP